MTKTYQTICDMVEEQPNLTNRSSKEMKRIMKNLKNVEYKSLIGRIILNNFPVNSELNSKESNYAFEEKLDVAYRLREEAQRLYQNTPAHALAELSLANLLSEFALTHLDNTRVISFVEEAKCSLNSSLEILTKQNEGKYNPSGHTSDGNARAYEKLDEFGYGDLIIPTWQNIKKLTELVGFKDIPNYSAFRKVIKRNKNNLGNMTISSENGLTICRIPNGKQTYIYACDEDPNAVGAEVLKITGKQPMYVDTFVNKQKQTERIKFY